MTPPFVKVINGIWTLARDEWTTPYVEKARSLKWDNSFAPCIEALGSRRGIMVDVGAFIGDSTAWFYEQCEVVTFEPQRDAFTCLQHNLPNGLHLPFPCGNGETVGLQFGEGGNMGARLTKAGETIRTLRIDDLNLKNVVFVKIDAEGWEPHILEGAKRTIADCKPLVRVEFNGTGLAKSGFKFDDIKKYFQGWREKLVYRYGDQQWDTLYLP